MSELPRSAEVVVVGGGAVGASVAYHLARRGVRGVIVIERDLMGSGSTSKAAGGVRVQFPIPVEVRFSMHSLALFHHFAEEMGRDAGFRRAGYLFLITDAARAPHFRALVDMQRAQGADVRWLGPEDVRDMVPHLAVDDVVAATFCPDEGYAGPAEVVQAFAARGRELGVRTFERTRVTGIDVEGGRVARVRTDRGAVSTRTAVNAAGPWARPLGELTGLDLPVFPRRRHVFVTEPLPGLGHPLPMIIDRGSGFYCRSEMQSVLMSPGDVGPVPEWEEPAVDWGMVEVTAERAVRRMPALARAAIASAWAGLRPLTPDEHAIVDVAPIEGMVLAVGFCGHGFQHSPAAGAAVAELIVDGRSSFDLAPLRLDRFGPRAALGESEIGEAD